MGQAHCRRRSRGGQDGPGNAAGKDCKPFVCPCAVWLGPVPESVSATWSESPRYRRPGTASPRREARWLFLNALCVQEPVTRYCPGQEMSLVASSHFMAPGTRAASLHWQEDGWKLHPLSPSRPLVYRLPTMLLDPQVRDLRIRGGSTVAHARPTQYAPALAGSVFSWSG
jgi:hypothetical protein